MTIVSGGLSRSGTATSLIICATLFLLVFPPVVEAQLFGDGSDGASITSGVVHLTKNMNYTDLTINSGSSIQTHGFVIRVSGTFINNGTITDSYSGGAGGSRGFGGSGGYGHSPHVVPAPGTVGFPGSIGSIPGAGSGGDGGAGGGGGGGAWDVFNNISVSGGNAGDGGDGGKGGGVVIIYARNFDNRSVISAEGFPGQAGTVGVKASYLSYSNALFPFGTLDMAGGGGCGGQGGDGGDGGTLTVYYQTLIFQGVISSAGGTRGSFQFGGGSDYSWFTAGAGQVEEDGEYLGGSTYYRGGRSQIDTGFSVVGMNGPYGQTGNSGITTIVPTYVCYIDADGDGYGDPADPGVDILGSCGSGLSTDNTDCDDTDSDIYPGAPEICDGKDNNCDTVIPPDEIDNDGDGFSSCEGDCFDGNPNIYPGNTETMCNGFDDDCDPGTPDDIDADSDGVSICADDCDDLDPSIYPGATEIPDDGIDQDCDGFDLISSCCSLAGDFNDDGSLDISDLTAMVDFMFAGGPAAPCTDASDVNGDNVLDISDLTYRVDFMFGGGAAPICGTTGS